MENEPVKANTTKEKKKELDASFSEEAKKVYSVLNENPTHIDDILRQTSLKMSEVLSAITELELMGDIVSIEGKKYSI